MFKKNWNIDYFECDIDKNTDITNKKVVNLEFYKEYARKTYILDNLRTLIKDTEVNIYDEREDYLLINFRKAEFLSKKEMIKGIISKLGFKMDDMSILLDKDTFTKNLEIISTDKEFFGSEKNRILFGFNKNTNKTVKSYMGFLNSVHKNWGIYIKNIIIDKQKNNKRIQTGGYKLFFDINYQKYI